MVRPNMKLGAPLVSLVLVSASCGDEGTAHYVGALTGTDARAAAVVEGESVLLYRCGGPTSMASTRWLLGTRNGERISLAKDDARFEGRLEDGRLVGMFEDGTPLEGPVTERGGTIGLYQATDGACRTGVIVGPGWIQGTSCDADGRLRQVSPDGPVAVDGFQVQAGLRRVFVERARLE